VGVKIEEPTLEWYSISLTETLRYISALANVDHVFYNLFKFKGTYENHSDENEQTKTERGNGPWECFASLIQRSRFDLSIVFYSTMISRIIDSLN
jgi:hypothetical protein